MFGRRSCRVPGMRCALRGLPTGVRRRRCRRGHRVRGCRACSRSRPEVPQSTRSGRIPRRPSRCRRCRTSRCGHLGADVHAARRAPRLRPGRTAREGAGAPPRCAVSATSPAPARCRSPADGSRPTRPARISRIRSPGASRSTEGAGRRRCGHDRGDTAGGGRRPPWRRCRSGAVRRCGGHTAVATCAAWRPRRDHPPVGSPVAWASSIASSAPVKARS